VLLFLFTGSRSTRAILEATRGMRRGGFSWKEKTPLLSIMWKCHCVIVFCFCLQEEGADEEVGWVGKGELVCCEHCASVIV
jgi:hypothetical protein